MTYTNDWTEVLPSSNDSASTIATEIRKLRIDIRERMETAFGVTHWDDDPLLIYILNMAITGAAKILAGSLGLAIRKQDDSASLVSVDENGDLTLLRYFLSGQFEADLTVRSGHTATFN